MSGIGRLLVGLGALALLGAPSAALAAPSVAVAKGKGPKKAAVAQVASALKKALAADGLEIVDAKPAGKKGKVDVKLARAVGATFLVVVDADDAKKKFRAQVEVLRVEDGSSIHSATSDPYAGKADAAKVARALSAGVIAAINDAAAAEEPRAVEAPKPKERPVSKPREEVDEPRRAEPGTTPIASGGDEPDDPEPAPRAVPKDEAKPAPESKAGKGSSGALPMFEVSVGAGTQASTAYTVLVGGTPTALAYTLSPLFLLDVGARVQIPSTALGVELAFSFSPVKFALDTNPPVTPSEPGGSFLELGGAVGWRFWLSGDGTRREGFAIEPLVGLRYESLSVDAQDRAIVLGASAIVPHFGVRALLGVSDALVFGADARLRLPLGYSESGGAVTGESGSGFGLAFGGSARFWIVESFGLGANLTYTYTSISFTGAGTRQLFATDPTLVDASVASSSLRLTVGALIAF